MPEINFDKVKDNTIFNKLCLIEDMSAIKIKTIKEKYLEQIPTTATASELTIKGSVIVGYNRGFIIFVRNGNLYKVHRTDLQSYQYALIIESFQCHGEVLSSEQCREIYNSVEIWIEELPQIFVD